MLERRPFHLEAADRVRAIADNHRHAMTLRGAQAVGHRVDEGVDAGADVLQVDDQRVEPRQHLGRGLPRLAVERVDRYPQRPILRVGRLDHVVLQVGAEAVLRAENGAEPDGLAQGDPIDDVPERAVDRGRIGDDADAQAVQAVRGEETFGTQDHRGILVRTHGERAGSFLVSA